MDFEDLSNISNREFIDISHETVRKYHLYHHDKEIVVEDPIAVHVSQRGRGKVSNEKYYDRHLVVDGEGNVHRIPFDPTLDLLQWSTKEDANQIVF